MPHICVLSLELHAGCLGIVAVQLPTNHNHESCIWKLWEVISRVFTHTLTQIRRRTLVASPSLLPHLPNLACIFLQKHLHPLTPNPFSIIDIFQGQPGLESLQQLFNSCLPVLGSFSQLFRTVLSLDNGPMLPLKKPCHPFFLPLVEHTKVKLPHPFGKLLQGESLLLQADWGFAFGPTQVRWIVALIICIVLIMGSLWQWGQIGNPGNICPLQFHSRLQWFCWEADGGSTRCAGKLSWSSGSGRGRPNDWIVCRRCCRHSTCAWRSRPMSRESLKGKHLRSTISSLGEIVSLPRWPITRISLSFTRAWL